MDGGRDVGQWLAAVRQWAWCHRRTYAGAAGAVWAFLVQLAVRDFAVAVACGVVFAAVAYATLRRPR